MAEDLDLLMRLERAGARIGHLDEPLTIRRIHGRNSIYRSAEMWSGLIHAAHRMATHVDQPMVSVIIPVFNTARYLNDAVRSVLTDSPPGSEVIVVDDGSDDGSFDVAQRLALAEPEVRAVRQPHAGAGAARNLGLLLARGKYIAMLDADDLSMPGRFPSQLERLQEDDSIDFVFGAIEEFISEDTPPAVAARLRPRSVATAHGTSSLLARRAAVADVGLFPVGLATADWPEWYARAVARQVRMAAVSGVVARRRLHGANFSLVHNTAQSQYLGLVRRSLARRRGVGS